MKDSEKGQPENRTEERGYSFKERGGIPTKLDQNVKRHEDSTKPLITVPGETLNTEVD